jgi:hypothetical protein
MEVQDKGLQGEEFVNELAYSSFLKFWCYPGPKDELGDRKEIADLLILFKNNLLILSVKNYEFKGLYDRYFRRTLEKAASQIYGAERKLLESKNEVFIKHPDRELEPFLPDGYDTIHRIIVNLGESVQFYPSGSITKAGKFVHVLDKEAFKVIIEELDTIPDLVKYLQDRERIFSGKDVLMLPGEEDAFDSNTAKQFFEYTAENLMPEEKISILISGTEYDLLVKYLENNKTFPDYFSSSEYGHGWFELDGAWDFYQKREEVVLKRKHDRYSYFVDEFVRREILVDVNDFRLSIAKELLSLTRFERRIVGQAFLGLFEESKDKGGGYVARRHGKVADLLVSFIIYQADMKPEAVDICLEMAMMGYSSFEGYQTKKSLLIAANNDLTQFKFGYMPDVEALGEAEEAMLRQDLDKLEWFQNPQMVNYSLKEYPDS